MPDAVNFWLGEAAAVTSCRCRECKDRGGGEGGEKGRPRVEDWAWIEVELTAL